MKRFLLFAPLLLALAVPATAQKKTPKPTVDFATKIWPILEKRCVECHQAPYVDKNGRRKKPKGRVELDSIVGIQRSKRGKVVRAGEGEKSLLWEVITLPAEDEDIMPPAKKGKPLSKKETDLIKKWIDEGAHFGKWQGKADIEAEKKEKAEEAEEKQSGKSGSGKSDKGGSSSKSGNGSSSSSKKKTTKKKGSSPLVQLAKRLKPVDPEVLAGFADGPFRVASIDVDNPLLQVTSYGETDRIDDAAVAALLPIASHIVELNLAATQITDKVGPTLAKMTNLVTLDLRQTEVSNHAVAALGKCSELRRLNLYGTEVGDYGVNALSNLKNLERLYLWQTEVSASTVVRLRDSIPGLDVVVAADLPTASADAGNQPRRRR